MNIALDSACHFLNDWLEYQFRQSHLVGLTVALHHKDEIILLKSLGLANNSSKITLTPDHLFNIGSQSKMMTATAIMQLVERGRLELSDRAIAYLPWLGQHPDPQMAAITIEQLLSHRAGLLRDGLEADFWQLENDFPAAEQLQQTVLKSQLVIDDLRYKYSNIGYALLGLIIAEVSQTDYARFVRQNIVEPLGLSQTHPAFSKNFESRIATGYTRPINGQRLPTPTSISTHSFDAVAGWYSNAKDLCRFMAAHFSNDSSILKPESKAWLHANHRSHWTSKERRGKDYGGGFMINTLDNNVVLGHVGSFIGHRSCSFYDPNLQVGVVVLANSKDAPVLLIARGVFSVLHHFLEHGNQPSSPEFERFNIRVMNLWSTIQIIATPKKVVAAKLGEWLPLFDVEELEVLDSNILRIVKADANASANELVVFTLQDNRVVSVNYAGSIFRPEKQFYNWLKNNWLGV